MFLMRTHTFTSLFSFAAYCFLFQDAFTVNPNGALVGDGRPGARSIDGMVAKQQAKQKLGGSFSREKKYLQYASLADETQVVSSTSSPFEAERKAETVYYMWAEDTPGPGTYDPAPLGSLQFPSAEQIEALPKARKAKLGLPKEQWEQPSQYEPPREMKKLVTGSRSERFTFGAATGIHQHDLGELFTRVDNHAVCVGGARLVGLDYVALVLFLWHWWHWWQSQDDCHFPPKP